MTFEKALEAMKQGKKAKPRTDKFAYEIHNREILLADEYASFIDVTNIPVELLFAEWEIYELEKKIEPDAFKELKFEPGGYLKDAADTAINFRCSFEPMSYVEWKEAHIDAREYKKRIAELEAENNKLKELLVKPEKEVESTAFKYLKEVLNIHKQQVEEDSTMYNTLEITFKSGDTISYNKDEWDDYSYDGKSVCVKKDGAWVGIYNFDNVFSVELKA